MWIRLGEGAASGWTLHTLQTLPAVWCVTSSECRIKYVKYPTSSGLDPERQDAPTTKKTSLSMGIPRKQWMRSQVKRCCICRHIIWYMSVQMIYIIIDHNIVDQKINYWICEMSLGYEPYVHSDISILWMYMNVLYLRVCVSVCE